MNARIVIATGVAAALASCGGLGGPRVVGSMREVMRDGRTEGRVALADALDGPHVVAIGALAQLQGEFLCIGGDVWIGRAADPPRTTVTRGAAPGDEATLLVADDVEWWLAVPLERDRDLPGLGAAAGASGRGLFVGFFTSGAPGLITHHGQRSHVHVKLDAPAPFVGHVDQVTFDAGATLRLPRR
jgi:hypothetical protein